MSPDSVEGDTNPIRVSLATSIAVMLGTNTAVAQIDVEKSVLTSRDDHWRRGAYLSEIELTPANVPSSFGFRNKLPLSGSILA